MIQRLGCDAHLGLVVPITLIDTGPFGYDQCSTAHASHAAHTRRM